MDAVPNRELPNTESELEMVLPALFENFVHYQNTKDIPGLLTCLHPESPAYISMGKSLEGLFDHYTLQVDIMGSTFGGSDESYAYYRFQQKIAKIAGPDFQDSMAENLIVFRQHEGTWKIWNYLPLWMKPL